VTGYGTVKDAVEAIRRGASDFISKPFQYDELRHVLDTALERRELRQENRYLREQLDARYGFEGLVGRSAAMRELCTLLATIAPYRAGADDDASARLGPRSLEDEARGCTPLCPTRHRSRDRAADPPLHPVSAISSGSRAGTLRSVLEVCLLSPRPD